MADTNNESENKTKLPVVLACAGLDPSGSAGLLADVRIISSLCCHPCGLVTCQTVQSSGGVTRIVPVEPALLLEQFEKILDDVKLDAVKIGAIASNDTIETIGMMLQKIRDVPIVYDPIVVPTNGLGFLDPDSIDTVVESILPIVFLATPNLKELGFFTETEIDPSDDEGIFDAAKKWIDAGAKNVLVTGIRRDDMITDRLFTGGTDGKIGNRDFEHAVIDSGEVHGTGCVLSSAIASYLALGMDLVNSVEGGISIVTKAIKNARQVGQGARFWVIGP